jgi:hypothetical protein
VALFKFLEILEILEIEGSESPVANGRRHKRRGANRGRRKVNAGVHAGCEYNICREVVHEVV